MTYDRDSFLSGLAVGRNLRGWPVIYGKYILLDYISSDGNQYFNTGIYVKPQYTASVEFRLSVLKNTWQTAFGTRDYDEGDRGGGRFTVRFHKSSDELAWQRSWSSGSGFQTADVFNVKNSFLENFRTVAISNRGALLDGRSVGTFVEADEGVIFDLYPLVIFSLNSAGNIKQGVIGDLRKAYIEDENGKPLGIYYPVQRIIDGAVGVFDSVSLRFLESGGTGSFIPHYFEEGGGT